MKLHITHTFSTTPAAYFDMLLDPAFDEMISRESSMTREVIELRDEGGVRFKRVRCRPQRDLPGPLKQVLGGKGLEYDQVNTLRPADGRIDWTVEVPAFPDRVQIGGVTHIRPHAEGCERELDGEVRVNVRLVGGRIERALVDDITKSYDKAAEAVRRWIHTHSI